VLSVLQKMLDKTTTQTWGSMKAISGRSQLQQQLITGPRVTGTMQTITIQMTTTAFWT
jgi:hypothetical protein